MDLNKETAMRLWNKSFGKETKVKDFAGREIAKGAYNNRNSEFGWNVDHILPQSKGGKTADYNLVVCHIKTNDEKADKFPCFNANGKKFEIIKVENHYEIKSVKQKCEKKQCNELNFFDSASGTRFFRQLKGIQNKSRFVGTVFVRLNNISTTAIVDFIENFFDEENISYSMTNNYNSSETKIIAKNYNMPSKTDISELLDKCILLNTYLSHYFKNLGYVADYDIHYRVDYYDQKTEMYLDTQKLDLPRSYPVGWSIWQSENYKNTLLINYIVFNNTEASSKETWNGNDYMEYNYIYTKLAKNLEKEVK